MTVHLETVSRRFASIVALDRASIEAPAGSITVLLGPNGAGKTTAIRLITGALGPDEGSVTVFGVDPTGPGGEDVRRRCGVVTAKPSLYDRLDGMDNLRYAAELFGLGRGSSADQRIVAAADQFDIADALDQEVGGYSTGMKTRLALSRAILHEPDLLLLDEPTSGLDPESAASVLELIRTMTGDGRTVLMCTHLLMEAEGLADRVVVMDAGTTVVSGQPAELASRYWPDQIVSITTTNGADLDWLAERPDVLGYERTEQTARLTIADESLTILLVGELVHRGAGIVAVEPYRPTLEDLYFAVRRRQADPPPPPPPSADASRPGPAATASADDAPQEYEAAHGDDAAWGDDHETNNDHDRDSNDDSNEDQRSVSAKAGS